MVQGGDPEGSGKGGSSYFDKSELTKTGTFKDEFHANLRHGKRGMLAMANSGPNTNRSQFYITFSECSHLDDKHSVFGEAVLSDSETAATLDKIEQVGHGLDVTGNRPAKKIEIVETTVLVNPIREAIAHLMMKEWTKIDAHRKPEDHHTAAGETTAAASMTTWAALSSKKLTAAAAAETAAKSTATGASSRPAPK